ncbi:interleukin 15, like isoform X2 [Clarias gariepinus]|uniref:interleukin 15, like isoform X2 n=1 Tax=Clarias gariepinus TaxID=13013 RepID=UPI00234CAA43|nr:interleukin 15, like isoform X2 [Clarias gariepinus]
MRRDVASTRWNMVLRRDDPKQFYMELTPLLFYLGAVVLRQVRCNSFCFHETLKLVELLQKDFPTTEYDSRLYTPTLSNYETLQGVVFSLQQNCSRSTMECFGEEMNVLLQETQKTKFLPIQKLPKRLNSLKDRLKDKVDACPKCEIYKEEDAKKFLATLLRILQLMCSKINNTTTTS